MTYLQVIDSERKT